MNHTFGLQIGGIGGNDERLQHFGKPFSGQIESPSNKSSYKFINAFSTSYLKQNEPLFNTVFGKH